MIAHIIPIKRMPANMGVLTYTVPPEILSDIQEGQLVTIPLRKSTEFGLVLALEKKESTDELKKIVSIVHQIPIVEKKFLDFLVNQIAPLYHVSAATIAKMALLPMQKRKLSKLELLLLSNKNKSTKDSYVSQYKDKKEHADFLNTSIHGTTLILVPEQHLVNEVYELLSPENKERTTFWHSDLSVKEQFTNWVDIRNKEKTIIIGTRGAVLLPIPNLDSIILDYEHNEHHKHWDQAPRFHAKDVALLRAAFEKCTLHIASFSPSAISYFDVHKKNIKGTLNLLVQDPCIINMKHDRSGGNFQGLSSTLQELILQAKKDIFLFIPKKGFARSLSCDDCSYTAVCTQCDLPLIYSEKTRTLSCHYCKYKQRISLVCPACHGALVKLKGRGTESIEKEVHKLLNGQNTHEIIRIDGDVQTPTFETKKPRIVIGTQMAFRHIRWDQTELVGFIDTDMLLRIPEYLQDEQTWHLIKEVDYRAPDATLCIQTHNPDHVLFRSLKEPDRFYRTNLNLRQRLHYPPYCFVTRYFFGHTDAKTAEKQIQNLHSLLQLRLTEDGKAATLSDPIEMHPRYYRGKFWYSMLVRSTQEDWLLNQIWLHKYIPPVQWKVDPNPISILSP